MVIGEPTVSFQTQSEVLRTDIADQRVGRGHDLAGGRRGSVAGARPIATIVVSVSDTRRVPFSGFVGCSQDATDS